MLEQVGRERVQTLLDAQVQLAQGLRINDMAQAAEGFANLFKIYDGASVDLPDERGTRDSSFSDGERDTMVRCERDRGGRGGSGH